MQIWTQFLGSAPFPHISTIIRTGGEMWREMTHLTWRFEGFQDWKEFVKRDPPREWRERAPMPPTCQVRTGDCFSCGDNKLKSHGFVLINSFRYNSQVTQCIHLQLRFSIFYYTQSCATITTINLRTFSSSQKYNQILNITLINLFPNYW